uniref:ATP synthase complex subunit 8 n=1 Tax=Euspilotus scissus TaxID=694456 RepID=D8WKP0_9COLE|nr:ATP synthase F0 subunit 8 [Euspilotus scissus]ACZ58573.1 ATP synthase F0 subunit 8 [Euspilotus scissus]
MPQMAPLNWLGLFFMFFTIFILMNTMNYFSFIYSPSSSTYKKIYTKINWKW